MEPAPLGPTGAAPLGPEGPATACGYGCVLYWSPIQTNAYQKDLFLLGELTIPSNLRQIFKNWNLKYEKCKSSICKFQQMVTRKMQEVFQNGD